MNVISGFSASATARRLWFAAVLIVAIALRLVLVLVLPFDAGPDERYRYDVMSELYRTNRSPRYGSGGPHFVVQPIFAYRLSAWVAHAVPGSLPLFVKLRFGSTVASALTVVLAYLISRNLWPARPGRAIALAALTAFFPKLLGLGTYLSADAFTVFASTLVLYTLAFIHRQGELRYGTAALLGVSLGLVFLGRGHGYGAVVLAAGYGLWLLHYQWRRNGFPLALAGAVVLAFPTAFYTHQYLTYGKAFIPLLVGSGISWVPPGFSIAEAYQRQLGAEYEWPVVHLGWWQPLHWVVFAVPLFTSSLVTFSYHWFDFPPVFYSLYLLFCLCSVAGWARSLRRRASSSSPADQSRRWLLFSAAAAGLALLGMVAWLNFYVLHQPDGRYLMPLAVPGLLGLLLGWRLAFPRADANRFVTAGGISFFIWSSLYSVWMIVRLYV